MSLRGAPLPESAPPDSAVPNTLLSWKPIFYFINEAVDYLLNIWLPRAVLEPRWSVLVFEYLESIGDWAAAYSLACISIN